MFVLGLVQGQYLVGGFVQAICAVAQFGMSAATFFAGVAGELDTVDGEHVAPDQALSITGHQDLTKKGFDLLTEAAHELGNVGVAGLAVAADGDELDIERAGLAQWCGWRSGLDCRRATRS